jgi:hypothetical protein
VKAAEIMKKGNLEMATKENLKSFKEIIRKSIENAPISRILTNRPNVHYIPFLPLTREAIKECIQLEMKKNSIRSLNFDKIIDEIDFEQNIYSTSGCKRVPRLVIDFKQKK